MEAFLEKNVEGLFKKGFREGMQPIEIGRALIRQMEEGKTISISRVYVPNYYIVRLSEADLVKIEPIKGTLVEELEGYLMEEAKKHGYSFTGGLDILFETLEGGKNGQVLVESRFIEEALPRVAEPEEDPVVEPHVLPQDKTEDTESTIVVRNGEKPGPHLIVISGNDEGVSFPLDEDIERFSIGRKETCDICLHDPNVSREHALIEKVAGKLIIRDIGSKNGTFLNDEKLQEDLLENGDIISLGTTVMRFKA
jgi:pSer/pThr/pTyr-binding forkhead associated (FHA) protein